MKFYNTNLVLPKEGAIVLVYGDWFERGDIDRAVSTFCIAIFEENKFRPLLTSQGKKVSAGCLKDVSAFCFLDPDSIRFHEDLDE